MTDLSIVIVSFNTREPLARTLEAVAQNDVRVDVHVIDNASHDGSAEMVRTRFPHVRLVANPDNRYYSAGNNQGFAEARGRHVLVLNPDAQPAPGALDAMVRYLDAHPEVWALSPQLRFPDGRVQQTCGRRRTYGHLLLEYSWLGAIFRGARARWRDAVRYASWDRLSEQDVEILPGSCIMVPRAVVGRIGGFDEELPMYFSDDDWCERIAAAGGRLRFAPVATVVHPEGSSTSQAPWTASRMYLRDMMTYTRKRSGRAAAALLWVLTRPTLLGLGVAAAWRRR